MIPSSGSAAWLAGFTQTFAATLSGLAFETLPFLLFGTLASSAIHVFVPDRALKALFPKNRYLSILVALGVGAFLPICECATVPLAKRLRDKGIPESTALAFLLAAPLVNPMTIASTAVAFAKGPYPMYALRLAAGLVSAFLIALVVELAAKGKAGEAAHAQRFAPLPEERRTPKAPFAAPGAIKKGFAAKLLALFQHSSDEFLDTSRYLIAGITIAALLRALGPAAALSRSLKNPFAAMAAGAGSAYLLSLCSSADAFVARALFVPQAYPAALAFLVLGPMIDVKNTILLSRYLKPRRLAGLVALIFAVDCCVCLLFSPLLGGAV